MPLLEVCIDNASGIDACIRGGADRIELCAALTVGGLTASVGLMNLAAQSALPVHALIRPRAGNFCYGPAEVTAMCTDINAASQAGVSGLVFGAAENDQSLALPVLKQLCKEAGALSKTLHRVIDTVADQRLAVRQAIDLGFDSILTSGGEANVSLGIDKLAAMNAEANGQITIIAGGGLTADAITTLAKEAGIRNFHASCRSKVLADQTLVDLGFVSENQYETNANLIQQFKQVTATFN